MRLDITRHIESVEKIIASHQIGTGQYRRWLWQDKGGTRNLDINEYGCADAANILYMIGRFPSEPVERGEWIAALQGLQDPETGLFVEATHHPIHTTAHCIAALELFEQKAKYPLKELRPYLERENLYALLDGLDIPVRFAALGASNAFQLQGTLPEDRAALAAAIDQIVDTAGEDGLRAYRVNLRRL